MENIKPILEQFAEALTKDVKSVTKRFSPTIENVVSDTGFAILGSPYISTLIDGRPPTSATAKKGNPTLQEIIYKWVQDKGITAKVNEQGKAVSQLSLSWAISNSIHMHGDLLYQRGGGNNIFSSIINQNRLNASEPPASPGSVGGCSSSCYLEVAKNRFCSYFYFSGKHTVCYIR